MTMQEPAPHHDLSTELARTVEQAAQIIRDGGLAAFPTETVYGLGANALDRNAVQKVFDRKGRPSTSPLIVHVSSIDMAKQLVAAWPPEADLLAARWWPGPLTLVLPKRPEIPDPVTAGLPTVGIRVPAHPVALALIEQAGVPVAAPSANRFTQLSPTTAQHVRDAFGPDLLVIDGGPTMVGIESTVVSVEEVPGQPARVTLLRPGMVSRQQIEEALGRAITTATDPTPQVERTAGPAREAAQPAAGEAHPAPGMHHRHYSPRTRLLLIRDPSELPGRDGGYLWREQAAETAHSHQMPTDPQAYAASLYNTLHQFDTQHLPWIAVETPPDTPEWAAIHDRLSRAAG